MYRKTEIDTENKRVAADFQIAALAMLLGLVLLVTAPTVITQEVDVLGDTSAVSQNATSTPAQAEPTPTGDYFPSHYTLHAPESDAAPAPTF